MSEPGIPPAWQGPVAPPDLSRIWVWFLVLGVALIVLGVLALGASVFVTLVSVLIFGWFLLIGGVMQVIQALAAIRWHGSLLYLLVGILDAIIGLVIVTHPALAVEALTLFLAALFLARGLFRIPAALVMPLPNRGWVLLSGVISFLLGVLIWAGWPESSAWVIGLFVAIDLIAGGWALVMLALAVRGLRSRMSEP